MAAIKKNREEGNYATVKKWGGKLDDLIKKSFDEQEKLNNAGGSWSGKIENFKLGLSEGIYGGVKGIGEGLVFLAESADKLENAAIHAVTHPTETAENIKDAAISTKDGVKKAADWVTTDGNVKKVFTDFGQANVDAYNWVTTDGNLENAAKAGLNQTKEALSKAKVWASKQSARDWGNYTGRGGFEAALMATGVGEVKAVVSGAEGANVLTKTAEAARLAEALRAAEALKAAKALELAEKLKAAEALKVGIRRELGEVVSRGADDVIELTPGAKGNWNKILNNKLKPNSKYKVGDKIYETDELGRVKRVKGDMELGKLGRNGYQQGKLVTLKDGTKGIDEGGHLIGHQFKGAGEQINYVPMQKGLNQGAWKKMESDWAKALKEVPPKKVEVDIRNIYEGVSKRPAGLEVDYWIDGIKNSKVFIN
ncbi:DNA/RNA non-specific endonuclease [Pedobacter sp. UYP30]|uniref:DNA/RNA non-specific endonuclease n=1 Tax=Pedobacter sp. UYP30 TaxID=1756400 RepID=UPI003392A1FC